jgi:sulfonate transport system substrate-binding protein
MIDRRSFQMLAAGLVLGVGGFAPRAHADSKTFRIAFQKGAGNLIFLKERGILERKLVPLGWSVTWTEFQAGPQLLESLNVGATDFGLVGEAPPIFAQAAGANIVYAGFEPASPKNEAIIVPKDGPIRTVTDLKGKRVALNKGSNVNYLIVRALEANGLTYGDIVPAYLAPADARAAFERGAVDAWVIWDPYYAAAELSLGARAVADGDGSRAECVLLYGVAPGRGAQFGGPEGGAGGHRRDRRLDQGQPQTIFDRTGAESGTSAGSHRARRQPRRNRRSFHRCCDARGPAEDRGCFANLKLIPKPLNVTDAAWKFGQ